MILLNKAHPTDFFGDADFIVIDTDYVDYMAVFECDRPGGLNMWHNRRVSILSRTPVMEHIYVNKVSGPAGGGTNEDQMYSSL